MSDFDTTEKIERTDVGYRLSIKSTRGTGTRDSDEVKAELRTETLGELAEQRSALVNKVELTMNQLRENQPDEVDDE